MRALEYGPDPHGQFERTEGLGQVVIGATHQSEDALRLLAACGQHHHRQIVPAAQFLERLKAAHAGQHHVEYQQVRRVGIDAREAVLGVMQNVDAEALQLQKLAQHRGQAGVVVYEQQAGGGWAHGGSLADDCHGLRSVFHLLTHPAAGPV